MPLYVYENRKTGEEFEKILPIARRFEPCRAPYIRLKVAAPKILKISDSKGKEDKLREDMYTKAQHAKKERSALESDPNYTTVKKELRKKLMILSKRIQNMKRVMDIVCQILMR